MAAFDRPKGEKRPAAATIGTFDGVHLGHRRLIEETRRQAEASGLRCLAVTFDRHPMSTVRPEAAPRLLTGLDHKLELLRALGVDVVVLEFGADRAAQSAKDFVERVLVGELGVRALVVGSTFQFGHRHRGNVALLRSMGENLGFSVTSIDLVTDDGKHSAISSSSIRHLVGQRRLDEARRLLGRDYEVRGEVVNAARHLIAIPAALLVPPSGDYRATWTAGGSADSGTARVGGTGKGGETVVELSDDPPGTGDGSPHGLVQGEAVAVRFTVPVGSSRPRDRSQPTSRSAPHR
jgi:riboflavin kinase/FMN adenylyltransferase